MAVLHPHLTVKTRAAVPQENCVTVGCTRVSVLLPQVIRIEFDKQKAFTDMPTQSIWYRDFGKTDFTHQLANNRLKLQTEQAEFTVNTANGKLISVRLDGRTVRPNPRNNLKGTARTLDGTFGPIPLKDGVVSKDGVALLDDSKSLILQDDGMVAARESAEQDIYVFAFGENHIGAVQALLKLTGGIPLVPRFVLGNWWSRYYPYSQSEYENLMLEFARKEIPLTVATIDMDWHWVDLKKHFSGNYNKNAWGGTGGWTGYSWNTDLFPDPKGFLRFLHEQGLKTTLNLHPAAGFRDFEDCYAAMAKAMGIDPSKKETVEFDIADAKFINSYLDIGHHPHEENGVDFWWMDWQQGTKSKVKGLDPLWSLNHYHYLDSGRDTRRPLLLSRYAGIGSHRYPLGFSGDTSMNWKVLRFQPYFTVTAANCGYTWWSHDIGGHHFGEHSDELYIRWVQFGVFSPILRLHSTQNDLFGKEPWNYSWTAEHLVTEALRLRHSLIPYIYTMNYRSHTEGRALCEPLYYTCPEAQAAYDCKNGYMFGSELLVCPVTSKCDKHTKRAETAVYLPEGRWTNFFTGEIYEGGKTVHVHSDLNTLPVFAKSGAIVPMAQDKGNGAGNPENLLLRVYRGDNVFTLYEDDGETRAYENGAQSFTKFTLRESGRTVTFTCDGTAKQAYLPEKRRFTLQFADIVAAKTVQVSAGGAPCAFEMTQSPEQGVTVTLSAQPVGAEFSVTLEGVTVRENPLYSERIRKILTLCNANNSKKSATYQGLKGKQTREAAVAAAKRVKNRKVRAWLLEVLCDMA